MAPVKKVRTYVNSNNSLVNNSVDAFNVLFAKNIGKRLIGRKNRKFKIQELPKRRPCDSLLKDDTFQISTEDTFDKILKSKEVQTKCHSIHTSLHSNSTNDKSIFLSSPRTRRQKANSCLISDTKSQLSQLSHSNQPSSERIEESLEIEAIKKNPNTSLSYITIPKNISMIDNSGKHFAVSMQQKLIHCSTPIAPSKAQIANYTISPIKENSLLKKSFQEIESWYSEFPAVTSTKTPRKFTVDHNGSKHSSPTKGVLRKINNTTEFNSPKTRTSFITLRHRKVLKSYRKRHKNTSNKKNSVTSFERFESFTKSEMQSMSLSRQKENCISQLSMTHFVTKRKNTTDKLSNFSNDSHKEEHNTNEEKQELCIRLPKMFNETAADSLTNCFEKFYSDNISSKIIDNVEDLSKDQSTCEKIKNLFVCLPRKSLDCEDFEEFFDTHLTHQIIHKKTHINSNLSTLTKENSYDQNISKNKDEHNRYGYKTSTNVDKVQTGDCVQTTNKCLIENKLADKILLIKLQKTKSQEDIFTNFLADDVEVSERSKSCYNFTTNDKTTDFSSAYTYNNSDSSYKKSPLLKSRNSILANSIDDIETEVKKSLCIEDESFRDLRVNLTQLAPVESKEPQMDKKLKIVLQRICQQNSCEGEFLDSSNITTYNNEFVKTLHVENSKNNFEKKMGNDLSIDLRNLRLFQSPEEEFKSFFSTNLDFAHQEQAVNKESRTSPPKCKDLKVVLRNMFGQYSPKEKDLVDNNKNVEENEAASKVLCSKKLVVNLKQNDYSHLLPTNEWKVINEENSHTGDLILKTNRLSNAYSELPFDQTFEECYEEQFETFETTNSVKDLSKQQIFTINETYDSSDIIESSIIETDAVTGKNPKKYSRREIHYKKISRQLSFNDTNLFQNLPFHNATADYDYIASNRDALSKKIIQNDEIDTQRVVGTSSSSTSTSKYNKSDILLIAIEDSYNSDVNTEKIKLRYPKRKSNTIMDGSECYTNKPRSLKKTEISSCKNKKSNHTKHESKENVTLSTFDTSTAAEGSTTPSLEKELHKNSKSKLQTNESEQNASNFKVQTSNTILTRSKGAICKQKTENGEDENITKLESNDCTLNTKSKSTTRHSRSKRVSEKKTYSKRSKISLENKSQSEISQTDTNILVNNVPLENNKITSMSPDVVNSSNVDHNCFKSPKSLLLKAGKSWRRSLSLYKRCTLNPKHAKDDQCLPSTTKVCQAGKLSCKGITSSNPSRRLSVRFVPVKPLQGENTTILEEYVLNTSYVPDQILEASLEDSFRCLSLNQHQQRNSSLAKNQQLGVVVPITAREIVLRKCGQTEPIQFSQCFTDSLLQNCQKIGEGVYGEVYLLRNPVGGTSVLKIIPVEGDQIVNGERQKKFEEVLSEIIITIELSNLRNNKRNGISSFTEVQKVQCVQGTYPEKLIDLWDLYDETRGSENDCPDMFKDDQLYIIFQMAYGGKDLESFVFHNAVQAYSMFQQVALGLAIAEEELRFEHRDLHWGNVLVSTVETNKIVSFTLENKTYDIPTVGVEVAIIDYTLSRIEHDGVVIFNDLGLDPDLFTAEGDYQFEIYRLMQEKNRNNWKDFEPFSNLLWLHYILDKAILGLRYKMPKSKIHKTYLRKLRNLKDDILSYQNVKDFIVANLLDIN